MCELREAVKCGRFLALAKGEALPADLTDSARNFQRERDSNQIVAVLRNHIEALAPSSPSVKAILDVLAEKEACLPRLDGKRQSQMAAFPVLGHGR